MRVIFVLSAAAAALTEALGVPAAAAQQQQRLAARRCPPPIASGAADALFNQYALAAPPKQSRLYGRCWNIVNDAIAATVPDATSDASAFDGALEAFVSAGPDDPDLVPEEQRGLVEALSDTAASYAQLVDEPRLAHASCYRTLNRPLGAYFCGISLWPRASVDVPNFTLYFGSGSAVNPDRVFMRLEMIPRVDTDTDAGYAAKYYEPFNDKYFAFLNDEAFEAYVSDSAYARGAHAPSGLRYFFDGSVEGNLNKAEDAVLALAKQWKGFLAAADELPPERAAELAARDAIIRRVAADSSPDNANREKVFGAKTFAQTKGLLCGELEL